ncbi:hypothetical protein SLEP1_g18369 [Rubroshorea leprosula]|uniref:Uncharacterized protein n=1 Tax=Rubroshorea leprosula TaxID=152421 RepID=A0AAV5J908_9ROSI|nr:hypothetical protein SLEP1_g18369 [Rubroshorea leprosula]
MIRTQNAGFRTGTQNLGLAQEPRSGFLVRTQNWVPDEEPRICVPCRNPELGSRRGIARGEKEKRMVKMEDGEDDSEDDGERKR